MHKSVLTLIRQDTLHREATLLAQDFLYQLKKNEDNEDAVKNCSTCMEFQKTQPKNNIIPHDISGRPWRTIGATCYIKEQQVPLFLDYQSKFPKVKWVKVKSTEHLITCFKIMFAEYR